MKSQNFTVVIEEGEDGYYIADVPELSGCHTQAKSMDELLKRVKEAIEANLEANRSFATFISDWPCLTMTSLAGHFIIRK